MLISVIGNSTITIVHPANNVFSINKSDWMTVDIRICDA